jgi:hypothetical protein
VRVGRLERRIGSSEIRTSSEELLSAMKKSVVRALVVLAGFSSLGCQGLLPKVGTFNELEQHATRLDYEFQLLHTDVKDILFGIEPEQKKVVWDVYTE